MAPNLHLTRSVWHDMEKYLGASYNVNKGNSCNDYKIYFQRGNKAENAAVAGCSGLIIFMDPSTVAM